MNPGTHGGPDAGPAIQHDFSTNASPCGAPPALLDAVLAARRDRYPDPQYLGLREQLAAAEGLANERLLPTAGSSEAIRRLTLAAQLAGVREVWVPQPGYGDYAAAALALGLACRSYRRASDVPPDVAALIWVCEPANPDGSSLSADDWAWLARLQARGAQLAIDLAYEPLRLDGSSRLPEALAAQAWRLVSPNKALGLTGVRAGYALAPERGRWLQAMQALAPSWVLSSEGVALLTHWHSAATREHLSEVREQLRAWRSRQQTVLASLGWLQRDSCTPFWLACPRPGLDAQALDELLLSPLRQRGIKLRDAQSFGLPGWVRVSTQAPIALAALMEAMESLQR